ncbi:MAG: deoxyribose-phosphate aldolase [Desulfocucumaceae bacterium]
MPISSAEIASMIDHTLLKPEARESDILLLCSEALKYSFKAVCVNPFRVAQAAAALAGSGVLVCAVAGFPLGAAATATKACEASRAVMDGASEIDMVINIGLLKEGKADKVYEDIKAVVEAVKAANPAALVKIIIETCFLTDEEKIAACRIAEKAGASFVKTSTGMGPAGATAGDIQLIKKTVPPVMGIKASGGIKSLDHARSMIEAGATRIGTSSGVQIMQELIK